MRMLMLSCTPSSIFVHLKGLIENASQDLIDALTLGEDMTTFCVEHRHCPEAEHDTRTKRPPVKLDELGLVHFEL